MNFRTLLFKFFATSIVSFIFVGFFLFLSHDGMWSSRLLWIVCLSLIPMISIRVSCNFWGIDCLLSLVLTAFIDGLVALVAISLSSGRSDLSILLMLVVVVVASIANHIILFPESMLRINKKWRYFSICLTQDHWLLIAALCHAVMIFSLMGIGSLELMERSYFIGTLVYAIGLFLIYWLIASSQGVLKTRTKNRVSFSQLSLRVMGIHSMTLIGFVFAALWDVMG